MRKRTKWIAGSAVAAVLLAGGGTAAWSITDSQRAQRYDENVAEALALVDEVAELDVRLAEMKYVLVEQSDAFAREHVEQMQRVTRLSEKLVAAETLEPVKNAVDELEQRYVAPIVDEDSEEVEEHPIYTVEDKEHYETLNVLFEETGQYEPRATSEPVTPPPANNELSERLTAEKITEAEKALEANAELRDTVLTQVEAYESQLNELEERVIEDAKLLVTPAEEALENSERFAEDFKKADEKSTKRVASANDALSAAVEQLQAGEEQEEFAGEGEPSEGDETEAVVSDFFSYVYEPSQPIDLANSVTLREAFTEFITAHSGLKKSHDAVVKEEKDEEAKKAAEEAAASGASEYQDPVTGNWVPTPSQGWANNSGGSWSGGSSTGGSSGSNGGSGWTGGNPSGGSTGSGNVSTPPSSGGSSSGSGSSTPPASSGGGSSEPTILPCPGPPQPGWYPDGSTWSTDHYKNCPNYIAPGIPDDW